MVVFASRDTRACGKEKADNSKWKKFSNIEKKKEKEVSSFFAGFK